MDLSGGHYIRDLRGAEKIIHILEKNAVFDIENHEISSKGLSEEVRTISEALSLRNVCVSYVNWKLSGSIHAKAKRS